MTSVSVVCAQVNAPVDSPSAGVVERIERESGVARLKSVLGGALSCQSEARLADVRRQTQLAPPRRSYARETWGSLSLS